MSDEINVRGERIKRHVLRQRGIIHEDIQEGCLEIRHGWNLDKAEAVAVGTYVAAAPTAWTAACLQYLLLLT
jgi:hypothetical protein